jgi:hypothetical protein
MSKLPTKQSLKQSKSVIVLAQSASNSIANVLLEVRPVVRAPVAASVVKTPATMKKKEQLLKKKFLREIPKLLTRR